MHAVDGLSFSGGVELRLHHEDFVCGGEVEAETAGADGDEDCGYGGVGGKGFEGGGAGFARHATIEAGGCYGVVRESYLDEIEMVGPGGEDDTGGGVSIGI